MLTSLNALSRKIGAAFSRQNAAQIDDQPTPALLVAYGETLLDQGRYAAFADMYTPVAHAALLAHALPQFVRFTAAALVNDKAQGAVTPALMTSGAALAFGHSHPGHLKQLYLMAENHDALRAVFTPEMIARSREPVVQSGISLSP